MDIELLISQRTKLLVKQYHKMVGDNIFDKPHFALGQEPGAYPSIATSDSHRKAVAVTYIMSITRGTTSRPLP